MKGLLYTGRWLFSALFIAAGFTHLTAQTQALALAHGIPPWLTSLAGLEAFIGGLCVATGWRSREGACLLVGFLVPVTLTMHRFWGLHDPQLAAIQFANFAKNAGLCGAALMIVYAGSAAWGAAQPSSAIVLRRATRVVRAGDLVGSRR